MHQVVGVSRSIGSVAGFAELLAAKPDIHAQPPRRGGFAPRWITVAPTHWLQLPDLAAELALKSAEARGSEQDSCASLSRSDCGIEDDGAHHGLHCSTMRLRLILRWNITATRIIQRWDKASGCGTPQMLGLMFDAE